MSEKKDDGDGKNTNSSVHDSRIFSPQGRYVRLDERLGSGSYKDVWRAYDTIEGIEVAWNVIKLSRVPPNERKRIKTEVKLLKDLEHPNVIKYHNSWVNREREEIVFITEIMSSGSLKEYIKKNPIIRWNAVKRWCQQILTGLEFLHSQQIIHRDIKCDNIFINGSTGDIRIGDLGLSTKIAEGNGIPLGTADRGEIRQVTAAAMTCLGTPEFMAPELYDENYNEKVDIYAFGMACLEMVTALTPYHDCTSAAQIYKKVINGELPPELSLVRLGSARRFIEACLQAECRRPSAAELLSYEFISPNEEDDFLEVRVRLDTVVEQATSLEELEDDEDNSDEEPLSSGIQRDHLVRQPTPMLPDNERMDHSESHHHHRGFADRSESRSTPRIPSQSSEDILTRPPFTRAKTLSQLNGDLISEQPNFSGPLSDPQSNHANFSQVNPNISSPEKNQDSNGRVDDNQSLSSRTPAPNNVTEVKTPDQIRAPEESTSPSTTTPNVRRRLSGNASSHSHEFHKTSSRVLRVCLTESGSRGRSSSFIDVPLSPITTEMPSDQRSLLPNSGMTPSTPRCDFGSSMSVASAPYELMPHPPHHHILPDSHHLPSHHSYPSYAAALGAGVGSAGTTTAAGDTDHCPPQNFLGVVDVGDKGSFDDNGTLINENCLIFRLRVPFEATFKEIEFGFDLLHDHPQSIVDEMNEVDELIFLTPYAKQIVDYLTPIVEVAKLVLHEKSVAAAHRSQEDLPLSNLVLERYLATRGKGKADPALAAWTNAAEERKIKENGMGVAPAVTASRSHQPIQVNLGTELHHSPPSTSRLQGQGQGQVQHGDELSRSEHYSASELSQSRSSKPITRSAVQSNDRERATSSTSIPSLVRDKSSNTSPTKIPQDNDFPSCPQDGEVPGAVEDNTQNILDDNDPEYQALHSKYLEVVAKIEKDYHHIKANIASQKEKAAENHKREHEKILNRQNDLNKQLENMEERFKERMSDFTQRKQQLYAEYLNKYPRRHRPVT